MTIPATENSHACFMPPGVGCPTCTCPDCGVVGLPYVCGSPDDPSGGQACIAREAALRSATCAGCNLSNRHPLTLVQVRGPFGLVTQSMCPSCAPLYAVGRGGAT